MTPAKTTLRHSESQRVASLDAMRLVLSCGVVLGHSLFLSDVSLPVWAGYANGLARMIVPFFLMLTGYFFHLVLNKGLKRWALGMTRVYLIWTLVFLPVILMTGAFSFQKLGFYLLVGFGHLWYLPALILGALMLAALRHWSDKALLALASALFLTGFMLSWGMNLTLDVTALAHRNAYYAAPRNFLFFGFPFLALGFVLRRSNALSGVSTRRLWALLCAALAILAAEVWIMFQFFGLQGFFDLLIGAALLAPVVFALCLRAPQPRWAGQAAALSAVIYLIHPLFIHLVWALWPVSPTLQAPVVLAMSVGASWVLLWLQHLKDRHRRSDGVVAQSN